MRKIDELALYAALRPNRLSRAVVADEADRLGIHPNRAFYLLTKWAGYRWIDYGVHVLAGWWTDSAPEWLEP